MKYLFAAALLTLIGSQAAHAETVAQWAGNPIINGDKTYTQISNDPQWSPVNVAASTMLPVYDITLSNMTGITMSGQDIRFSIQITDPTMAFALIRASENDSLGDATAGTTTNVYSDAGYSNLVFSQTLLQTQQGTVSGAISGLTTIYVDVRVTGVDTGLNSLNDYSLDVTQFNPSVPEPSSIILLSLGGLAAGIFARRRAVKRTA